jgi:hypothetical protein
MLRIFNGAAQNFVGEWGDIAFAKKQEPEEVRDWIAFAPIEIGVRHFAGCLFEIDQEGGERIGNHRTRRPKDPVFANAFAGYHKILPEVRGVARFDLEEKKTLG